MRRTITIAAAVAIAAMNVTAVSASDSFTFPSSNGVALSTTTPHFAPVLSPKADAVTVGGALSFGGLGSPGDKVPLPLYAPERSRAAYSNDPYAYHFLTHALASQGLANYAADYYRLFVPGHAVTAWTDRVAGMVEVGYGGAVDSWTGGAYYLGRVRGPRTRRNAPPDLSTMPTFRAHPELETHPTFKND
jgi:hypothetical protein